MMKPMEDEVAGISGVDTLVSTASEEPASPRSSSCMSANSDQAASDVERALARVKASCRKRRKTPPSSRPTWAPPIMNVTLSGPQALDELHRVADRRLKARLLAVAGVAEVPV